MRFFNLADVSKLPPAMQAQVQADQERALAARERIMGKIKFTASGSGLNLEIKPVPVKKDPGLEALLALPAKSPKKAVSEAMQAILPQCPNVKVKSKVPKQDESRMQQEVIRWFRDNCYEWQLEEELLMAIPLQANRSPRNGARMKAEGARRGTPDLLLAVPRGDCCALWIEMKTAKGYLNPFQKLMLARLTKAGAATVVCRSAQEAQHAIRGYLNLPTPSKP